VIPEDLLGALGTVDQLAVRTREPLGRHNLMRVGGPVDLWLVAESEEAAVAALTLCKGAGVRVRTLAGDHWLARDDGLEGACLVLGAFARRIERVADGPLRAGARVAVAALAQAASRQGLTGLEACGGRPGTVAEALTAGLLAEHAVSLRVLRGARATTLAPASWRPTQALVSVDLALGVAQQTTLLKRTAQVLRAGPERPGRLMADPPRHRAADLIADAGLRGVRLRAVRVGRFEPNCLVNLGGASARDVALVSAMVRDRVRERTGAELSVHPPHLGRAQAMRDPHARSRR